MTKKVTFNRKVVDPARVKAIRESAGCPGIHGLRLSNDRIQESDALGVHPDQIPEAMQHAQDNGYEVTFNQQGTAYFRSYRDFDRATKSLGLFNKKW